MNDNTESKSNLGWILLSFIFSAIMVFAVKVPITENLGIFSKIIALIIGTALGPVGRYFGDLLSLKLPDILNWWIIPNCIAVFFASAIGISIFLTIIK